MDPVIPRSSPESGRRIFAGVYFLTGYGQVHLGSQNYPSIHARYPQIVHNLWKEEE